MNDKKLYEQILKEFENELWEIDNHYSISENTWSNLGVISRFIENTLNPKPYKFEDLKEGMWVWDDKEQVCCQIGFDEDSGQLIYYFYDDGLFNVMGFADLGFEENRFYPPSKANCGK